MANKEAKITEIIGIKVKENKVLDDDFEAKLRAMADEDD